MSTLNERLALAEKEIENVDRSIEKIDDKVDELGVNFAVLTNKVEVVDSKVTEIQSKLNKQNGALPQAQKDIAIILTRLDSHIENEGSDAKAILSYLSTKADKRDSLAVTKFQVRTIWGILGAIGLTVVGILAKVSIF